MKLEIEVPDDFEPTMIAVGCKPEYKLCQMKFFPYCDSRDIEYLINCILGRYVECMYANNVDINIVTEHLVKNVFSTVHAIYNTETSFVDKEKSKELAEMQNKGKN